MTDTTAMERLAELIDRLDNHACALSVSMPDSIHVECMRAALPKIVNAFKAAYVEAGGENYWSAQP